MAAYQVGEMLPAEGKHEVIREYARASGYRIFVETGTADGNTLHQLIPDFDRLYSIELDTEYYLHNFRRFAHIPKITVLHGDSERVLWHVMEVLTGPAVFWLDAHYCGGARAEKDTPIVQELAYVMGRGVEHVILIDDARLFGVDPAYPSIGWIHSYVKRYKGVYSFNVGNDIIRIAPRGL